MKLENLTIAIRPRRDWEAVDLGILMARHWWWPLFRTWLIFVLPLIPAVFFLAGSALEWYLMCIWLVKPLLERPLLMILSQGVFGSTPTLTAVIKAAPKLLLRQSLASLTWRRLSTTRSMDLAVQQLEGLNGQERTRRLTILHRQDAKPAAWLTVIGVHMESFLTISMLSLMAMLIPDNVNFNWWGEGFELHPILLQTVALTYILAMGLVAPFYVACGFSLYLNRRAKLEGWDLEIGFKRMIQRRSLHGSGLAVLLALFIGGTSVLPTPAMASEESDSARVEARREFHQIVHNPPFLIVEEERVLRRKSTDSNDTPTDIGSMRKVIDALASFFNALSRILEIALWAAVAALVILVALRYRRWQAFITERWPTQNKRPTRQPETLFGLDVSSQTLPADVSAEAQQLWRHGEHRSALALLYRASLSRLLHRGLPLEDGATEQECLRAVELHAQQYAIPSHAVTYFHRLTRYWRQLAYGHQEPPADEAMRLCETWNACWLETPSEP